MSTIETRACCVIGLISAIGRKGTLSASSNDGTVCVWVEKTLSNFKKFESFADISSMSGVVLR